MAAKRKSSPAHGEGRGEATRLALIRAALDLFGAKGFEAASTRAVAAAAGANLASIAYHFGGKEGLRLACADHVVQTIRGALAPALATVGAAAADPRGGARPARAGRRGDRRLPGRAPGSAVDRPLRRARDVRAD